MKAGGGTRSYSRRAAGPAPSVLHLRWQGTPPGAGACQEVTPAERGMTSDGAGRSRMMASDARRKDNVRGANDPHMLLPQGACLAWRRGGVGEEPWHGESSKGSFPDYLFIARAA